MQRTYQLLIHLIHICQYNRTRQRVQTFFDGTRDAFPGVCHIPMEPAFCNETRQVILEAAAELGLKMHSSGTAVTIEGPRFSSKAESNMFRSWNAQLVNMTLVPEVRKYSYTVLLHSILTQLILLILHLLSPLSSCKTLHLNYENNIINLNTQSLTDKELVSFLDFRAGINTIFCIFWFTPRQTIFYIKSKYFGCVTTCHPEPRSNN